MSAKWLDRLRAFLAACLIFVASRIIDAAFWLIGCEHDPCVSPPGEPTEVGMTFRNLYDTALAILDEHRRG